MNIQGLDMMNQGVGLPEVTVPKSPVGEEQRLQQVAKEMEGIFASYMLKELTESLARTEQLGGGDGVGMGGSGVYSDFYSQILSDVMTSGNGLGLKQTLYEQFKQMLPTAEEEGGQVSDAAGMREEIKL